ncbi:MAG: hypothetical protein JW939_06250, partial [Candidatus Thermoplasmatota archaeon]|nr:hypothetical protein [Candidatus Thermoplasmatota archaeon]
RSGSMSGGAVVCTLLSGALCLGGLVLYLLWMGLLARFLARTDRSGEVGKNEKEIDDHVIDVEFEDK